MYVRVDRIAGIDWGWYEIDGKVSTWDGARLTIRRDKTNIDVVFDEAKQEWSGSFAANGPAQVRLRRPAQGTSAKFGSLAGTWRSDGPPRSVAGCLHLATRRDGTVIAWLDREFDGRYGEELVAVEFLAEKIAVQLAPPVNATYSYRGTVTGGSRLRGTWTPGLQAPDQFVVVPESACPSSY
jgi:hypothetical protein